MANKSLFASIRGKLVPQTDSVNSEMAPAYAYTAKQALAQYASTSCFSHTFYATAQEQFASVIKLCESVEPDFVARTAVYSRRHSYMKDTPALLCAWLSAHDSHLHRAIFNRVIDTTRMLRTYVQIMRSGIVGRKSLGTGPKQLIVKWLSARAALARLSEEDDPDPDAREEELSRNEAVFEEKLKLNDQRIGSVLAVLKNSGAKRVLDLGCGEGKLLKALLEARGFEEIVGMDVSYRCLERAQERLHLDSLPERVQARIKLLQGSLIYRDSRLAGYDAAAVMEVIEHLDPARLEAFERVLFEYARPRLVVLTTPNSEYNIRFETLPAGQFRHQDHRFEWTRPQFEQWARGIADRFKYSVSFLPIGPQDSEVGSPTQMGVFNL